MAYTTIVTGTTITSSWANTVVRDQVVTPFASSAARTSAISSPVNGMLSTLTPADATNGIYHYNGAAWRPPWNLPWGKDGMPYLVKTAAQTTATAADLTGMSTTWTPVARRKYRIYGGVPRAQILTTSGEAGITIAVAGAIVAGGFIAGGVNDISPVWMEVEYDAPSASPVNLKMSMGVVTAGGVGVTGSATTPIVLGVVDIGPAGAPS